MKSVKLHPSPMVYNVILISKTPVVVISWALVLGLPGWKRPGSKWGARWDRYTWCGSNVPWEVSGSPPGTGDLAGTLSLWVGVSVLFLSWDTGFPALMPPIKGRKFHLEMQQMANYNEAYVNITCVGIKSCFSLRKSSKWCAPDKKLKVDVRGVVPSCARSIGDPLEMGVLRAFASSYIPGLSWALLASWCVERSTDVELTTDVCRTRSCTLESSSLPGLVRSDLTLCLMADWLALPLLSYFRGMPWKKIFTQCTIVSFWPLQK